MLGIRSRIGRAAATHRRAAAIVAAAETALGGYVPAPRTPAQHGALYALANRLEAAAARLAPGWLGSALDVPLDAVPPMPDRHDRPGFVRIGTARPLPDAEFPVVVPLGHVAFDLAAGEDPRVAGVLQAIVLRLVAAATPGALSVRVVDPEGAVAGPLAPLARAGVMAPPVLDRAGLAALLKAAEQRGDDRTLVLVLAGWPADTEFSDIDRLAALAAGPPGLHLLVAGWPPAQATAGRPLPGATQVTLDDPYVLVGHPPGGSFGTGVMPGVEASAGLNAEVVLDPAPAPALVGQVGARVGRQVGSRDRPGDGVLSPHRRRRTPPGPTALSVEIGNASGTPVTLRLGGATWHWLIGGGPGSGKSTMLHHLVRRLASRYGPEELALHLLDPADSGSLAPLAEALPQVRASALGSVNRVRAGLHEIAAQAARHRGPRRVCVLDNLDALPDEPAYAVLCSLATSGPDRGVHLVLAGDGAPGPRLAAHCRVRIALPGAQVLDPANDAASGLVLGAAVVNTASGLGGPRGVTRAHEQLVSFPDPYADPYAGPAVPAGGGQELPRTRSER
jgi:DNA segregation ATPase FtsK/SpoIIIE, S-DNA-T family